MKKFFSFLFILSLLFVANPTYATSISFDAFDYGGETVGSPQTYSHTTAVGSNRGIFVDVEEIDNGFGCPDPTPTVTYAGVSLSQIAKFDDCNNSGWTHFIFYLAAPATGANNVIVSQSGGTNVIVFSAAWTFQGVGLTPLDGTGTGHLTSNGSPLSVNLTPTSGGSGDWALGSCGNNAGSAPATALSGSWSERSTSNNHTALGDSNGTVTSGSNTYTCSGPSSRLNLLVINIQPGTQPSTATFNPWQFFDF